MNSLVLSEIDNEKFENENIFVLEQYFKDFYKKHLTNNIIILPPYNEKRVAIAAYEKCNKIYKRL